MDYQLVISLKLKWQIKDKPQYKWSSCKRLINTNTGKEIRKTLNGSTKGYWIGKDFIPLSKMSDFVELIKVEKTVF